MQNLSAIVNIALPLKKRMTFLKKAFGIRTVSAKLWGILLFFVPILILTAGYMPQLSRSADEKAERCAILSSAKTAVSDTFSEIGCKTMADSPAKASPPTYDITCRPLDNPDGRCIRISLSLDGRIRDLAYYIETQPDEDLKENCRIFQEALEEMNRTLNQAGLTAEHAELLACAAIPNTVLEKSTSLPPKNRKL